MNKTGALGCLCVLVLFMSACAGLKGENTADNPLAGEEPA